MKKILAILFLSPFAISESSNIYNFDEDEKNYKYLICKPSTKVFTPEDSDERNTFIEFYKITKEVTSRESYSVPKKELADGIQITLSEKNTKETLGKERIWAIYKREFFAREGAETYFSGEFDYGYDLNLNRKTLKLRHKSHRESPGYKKEVYSTCKLVSFYEFHKNRDKLILKLQEKENSIRKKHESELQI